MYCTRLSAFFLFFFKNTATTEIYTLSLHDALPIFSAPHNFRAERDGFRKIAAAADYLQVPTAGLAVRSDRVAKQPQQIKKIDRKSTRLNSSHSQISYAVFCLKKKNKEARSDRRIAY